MVGVGRNSLRIVGFGSLLFLVAGCGGPPLVFTDTVEGTVTLDGVVVPGAHVEFVPQVPEGVKAPTSSAVTDSKGFFQLTRNDNHQPGALVGTHHVVIFAGRPDGARDRDAVGGAGSKNLRIPPVYASAGQTPLKIEVKSEQKNYDLRLSQTPARAR